ncbi:MAG TPA: hypothetical protein VGE68_02460 [Sphingomicrobium sp.]
MRASLLAATVILAAAGFTSPSAARDRHDVPAAVGSFRSAPTSMGVVIHRGGGGRHSRGDDVVLADGGGFYYGGEWALYNNRSWEKDSYNDWWHDNPDRAFPRWVTSGQCARQWYAADTLRC